MKTKKARHRKGQRIRVSKKALAALKPALAVVATAQILVRVATDVQAAANTAFFDAAAKELGLDMERYTYSIKGSIADGIKITCDGEKGEA